MWNQDLKNFLKCRCKNRRNENSMLIKMKSQLQWGNKYVIHSKWSKSSFARLKICRWRRKRWIDFTTDIDIKGGGRASTSLTRVKNNARFAFNTMRKLYLFVFMLGAELANFSNDFVLWFSGISNEVSKKILIWIMYSSETLAKTILSVVF